MLRFTRLRSRLIVSHLAAIALTLISMVAAVVLIAGNWFAGQQSSLSEPTNDARIVASAIGGMVAPEDSSSDLNAVLRLLARGNLDLTAGTPGYAPGAARRFDWFAPSLGDLAYVVVIGPDGQPMASSEPGGAGFAPPERPEWESLARFAMAGDRDPRRLVTVRSGGVPAALGVYPILDPSGRPVAAVVVATRHAPAPASSAGPGRALAFFGAASAVALLAASVFALVISGVVGYLLSRGLVARLEGLGQAAESLAAGDLSRRVEEGPADEIGQLARRFNFMARRLSSAISELEAAKRFTETALQTKRELVMNVSHELRTPLALIRGHVESLLMQGGGSDQDRQREYLAVIERETENLSRLIDDLFTLSTAEAGALSLKLEPVSLDEVVQEVAGSIGPIARRERQITVVTSVAPGLAPVLADRRRVVQILGNLVRNALRHTPEGGLIAVRVAARDDQALVTVEDTGEGIPPDRLPRVFERFYRGDDARDRASGGAGLGLAIVRELVEAMKGSVTVESAIGQGTRFAFSLPLSATVRVAVSSNQ